MILEIRDNYTLKELLIDIGLLIALYLSKKIKIKAAPFPRINGVYASKGQIQLAESLGIKRRYINYKIGNSYADMVYPRKRVVIEYNGKYWHKGSTRKDNQRAQELVRQGWKVLIITVNNKAPDAKWVKEKLELLNEHPIIRVEY